MKLSEFKGDEALEVLADLVEPCVELFKDKELIRLVQKGETRAKGIAKALRDHKDEVFTILAITEGETVEEYRKKANIMSLPKKLLEIFNDKELVGFLSEQAQMEAQTSFGLATESTEEEKQ